MSYMKDGLLLAAGGAIGLIAGVMLCDTLQGEQSVEEVGGDDGGVVTVEKFITNLRDEAFAAMEKCETDEERAAVYADVQDAVQIMRKNIADRCESFIRELQERSQLTVAAEKDLSEARAKHIKDTLQNLTDELDSVLKAIAPNTVLVG